MEIPKLKRINIHSEKELDVWLTRHSSQEERVMVVTRTNAAHRKFVSREQIGQVLAKYGWKARGGVGFPFRLRCCTKVGLGGPEYLLTQCQVSKKRA